MDSPLGVLLATFFMGCVEVFIRIEKPKIYDPLKIENTYSVQVHQYTERKKDSGWNLRNKHGKYVMCI